MDDDAGVAVARLRRLVRSSPLRVHLLRVSDGLTLEVSDSFAAFFGLSRSVLLTMRASDYPVEPKGVEEPLALLATGALDGYTRQATVTRPDGVEVDYDIRVTAWPRGHRRDVAVTLIMSPQQELQAGPDLPDGMPQRAIVLGSIDGNWAIDRLTSDADEVLDVPAVDLLGRSLLTLVHPDDVPTLYLLAAHATEAHSTATATLRLSARDDVVLQCRFGLNPLAGPPPSGFAFCLASAAEQRPTDQLRAKELEDHLQRIAREVEAAGIASRSRLLPTSLQLPELSALTSREYEIVVLLAAGHRVDGLAKELYLSQSTVRNHLSAVFRKLGVRSQSDLLSKLRGVG